MSKSKIFWSWKSVKDAKDQTVERVLSIDGTIADESWWGDEVTPAEFRKQLFAESGPVTIWINSPGGDVSAAAQIYNMLRDYPGKVTAKIDGIAASAASVIAMAADEVLMSPVSTMMIHNPWTIAWGDERDMERVKAQLAEVKETIINAYQLKTGLDRKELSDLMDDETYFEVYWAIEHKFADGIIERRPIEEGGEQNKTGRKFGSRSSAAVLMNRIRAAHPASDEPKTKSGPRVDDLIADLKTRKSSL